MTAVASPARRSGRMLSELAPVMKQMRDDIRFDLAARGRIRAIVLGSELELG